MAFSAHHGPLSNTYVLLSIFGFLLSFAIWSSSPSWGFLILLVSIIMFISSYVSAVRAPLMSDEEIELAIHEKYSGRRYPDTDLHKGMVPKQKKYLHSKHKKVLVQQELEAAKKPAVKLTPPKTPVKASPAVFAKKKAAPAQAKPSEKKQKLSDLLGTTTPAKKSKR